MRHELDGEDVGVRESVRIDIFCVDHADLRLSSLLERLYFFTDAYLAITRNSRESIGIGVVHSSSHFDLVGILLQ